jgi:hypothetical protein
MKKIITLIALMLIVPMPAFAGSATLTWDAPTQYTDGTPLNPATDLSGYVLGWGLVSRTSVTYPHSVNVPNPGSATVTYTLTSLPTGTVFFSARAITIDGIASGWSNEIVKRVIGTPGTPTNLTAVSVSAS